MNHRRTYPGLKLVILAGALLALFGSCNVLFGPDGLSPQAAEVRFQNVTTDFSFYYGLGFGDAVFEFTPSSSFDPGEVTDYAESDPGSYSVQAKTNNGSWVTAFDGTATVEAGGKYTIVIQGTNPDYYASIAVDKAP